MDSAKSAGHAAHLRAMEEAALCANNAIARGSKPSQDTHVQSVAVAMEWALASGNRGVALSTMVVIASMLQSSAWRGTASSIVNECPLLVGKITAALLEEFDSVDLARETGEGSSWAQGTDWQYKTPPALRTRTVLSTAICALVEVSASAREVLEKSSIVHFCLQRIQELHDLIALPIMQCSSDKELRTTMQGPHWGKRLLSLRIQLVQLLRLLGSVLLVSDMAKEECRKLGFLVLSRKIWILAPLIDRFSPAESLSVLPTIIAVLVNYTRNAKRDQKRAMLLSSGVDAEFALVYGSTRKKELLPSSTTTSTVAVRSLRGRSSATPKLRRSGLPSLLTDLTEAAVSQAGTSGRGVLAQRHLFAALGNLALDNACLGALAKIQFIECACKLLTGYTAGKRSSRTLDHQGIVLNFLVRVSASGRGRQVIMQQPNFMKLALGLLCSKSSQIVSSVALLLRNIALNSSSKSHFVVNEPLLTQLLCNLESTDAAAGMYSAACLWAIVYNSQRAKTVLKRADAQSALTRAKELFSGRSHMTPKDATGSEYLAHGMMSIEALLRLTANAK